MIRFGKYAKKNKLNSEMTWKIWKKSKLNSEMLWKIRKKGKLNSERIWKIQKKIVKRCVNYGIKVSQISEKI